MKGPENTRYRDFLKSDDYDRYRLDISRKKRKLDKRIIARLRRTTRHELGASQTSAAQYALELMYGIDPKTRIVGKAAGGQLWSRIVVRGRKVAHISQMRLGETITSRKLSLNDLNGRIVLWRSFSM